MSATSEMLAELVPQLAPTVDQVADDELVGMWAYRDEGIERLIWRGRDADCAQLESAVETALWLFEDRRSQGDTATIEVADGTVVIEHGARGVIAAWYGSARDVDGGTDHGDPGRAGGADHEDETAPGTAPQTGSPDRAASTGSLRIDTRPDQTAPSEASAAAGSADGADRAPRRSRTPADATESSGRSQYADRDETERRAPSSRDDRSDSQRPSGADRQRGRDDTSAPEVARSNPPETTRQPRDGEASRTESEPLNFEIAFVDHDDSTSGSRRESSSTGPVCDWAEVIDHLEALTEMVNDHLGDTVTMNYWREALGQRDALEQAIEVEIGRAPCRERGHSGG
jgi:hypothetical protein